MANRLNLGGWYASQGEQSYGDMRARFFVEYSNATANLVNEIFMNESGEFDSPRQVLSALVAGEDYEGDVDIESYIEKHNDVDPEEYDREEWIASQEEAEEAEAEAEAAEADD